MQQSSELVHARRKGALLIMRQARQMARRLRIPIAVCEWNLGMTLSGVRSHRLEIGNAGAVKTIYFLDEDLVGFGMGKPHRAVNETILKGLNSLVVEEDSRLT